jgi:hypothetical protein
LSPDGVKDFAFAYRPGRLCDPLEDEIHRACTTNGEAVNAYRTFFGKPEGKRPLGRPRRRRADNIEMDLRPIMR